MSVAARLLQLLLCIWNVQYNVNTMMPNMLALGVYDYQPVDGKYTVPDLPGIGNEISDTAYRNSTIATIE